MKTNGVKFDTITLERDQQFHFYLNNNEIAFCGSKSHVVIIRDGLALLYDIHDAQVHAEHSSQVARICGFRSLHVTDHNAIPIYVLNNSSLQSFARTDHDILLYDVEALVHTKNNSTVRIVPQS